MSHFLPPPFPLLIRICPTVLITPPRTCRQNGVPSLMLGTAPSKAKIQKQKPLHPGVRIGHVHLKVADLDRAIAFYRDVLGFDLTQRYGNQAAFLSAGGYHHHIGLNTWESESGPPPAPGTTGLYHLAIVYPTRAELADALLRLQKSGIPLEGASDHGVSEALYLRDPDGNGVELYWDRPKEQWPRSAEGAITMFTHALDLKALLQSASG
jgi:catechol 2,3-dioxygenase